MHELGFADLALGTLLPVWTHAFSRDEIETYADATGTTLEYLSDRLVCPLGLLGHYSAVRGQMTGRLPDGSLHITQRIEVSRLPIEDVPLAFQTEISRKFQHRDHPHFEFTTRIRDSAGHELARAVSTYRWAF